MIYLPNKQKSPDVFEQPPEWLLKKLEINKQGEITK